MLKTKTRMALLAGAGGLCLTGGLIAYNKMSKKTQNAVVPALLAGGVYATASFLYSWFHTYYLEKEIGKAADAADAALDAGVALPGGSTAGVGLLNVQRMGLVNAQRMGVYMPAPTVKKFSTFTGTRYYS